MSTCGCHAILRWAHPLPRDELHALDGDLSRLEALRPPSPRMIHRITP